MLRILTALVMLLLLVGVIAWFRGWLTLDVSNPDDRTHVAIDIDREKAKQDIEQVRTQVETPPAQELKGTLMNVDTSARTIELQYDKGTMTLEVVEGTAIRLAGRKAALADLRAGMRVAVSYTSQDGRNVARSIRVEQEGP